MLTRNSLVNRQYELSLQRSVATVEKDEAENGAAQSDLIRLTSTREYDNGSQAVPLSVYLSRAAQFRSQLKTTKKDEEPKPECPVDKARSQSLTGENVPLNWLMADQFGGQELQAPGREDVQMGALELAVDNTSAVFTAQPKVAVEPQSLLADEWLLSPCA